MLVDPDVDPLPPAEQPLDLLVPVLGDLRARHLPPLHQQPLVHRQLTPDVADGEQVIHARVRNEHDVGRRCGVQRREEAARPRCQHVGHRLGAVGHPVHAQLAQPLDPPLAPARGEVAALREDHERVVRVEPRGQLRDLVLDALSRRRVRRDEAGGDPVQQHVDGRVPRQRVLQYDARLTVVPVHQGVDQREGVARPRVPAADQQRLARVRVGRRSRGLDGQVEHPPGLAEEHPEHALDEVVVDALVVRRPDARPEARRDPQPEQDDQQHALADQVQDQHPQQAQRSPAARQQRRQRGGGDQPQRERDADQHRHQDHDGRGDQPAYLASRPGVAPAHRGTCSSR